MNTNRSLDGSGFSNGSCENWISCEAISQNVHSNKKNCNHSTEIQSKINGQQFDKTNLNLSLKYKHNSNEFSVYSPSQNMSNKVYVHLSKLSDAIFVEDEILAIIAIEKLMKPKNRKEFYLALRGEHQILINAADQSQLTRIFACLRSLLICAKEFNFSDDAELFIPSISNYYTAKSDCKQIEMNNSGKSIRCEKTLMILPVEEFSLQQVFDSKIQKLATAIYRNDDALALNVFIELMKPETKIQFLSALNNQYKILIVEAQKRKLEKISGCFSRCVSVATGVISLVTSSTSSYSSR